MKKNRKTSSLVMDCEEPIFKLELNHSMIIDILESSHDRIGKINGDDLVKSICTKVIALITECEESTKVVNKNWKELLKEIRE